MGAPKRLGSSWAPLRLTASSHCPLIPAAGVGHARRVVLPTASGLRTATAPYVPELRGPADTSNFSYADLRTSGAGGGDGPEDGGARHHAAWEAF